MEYQEEDMTTTHLLYAIEALGFDEESISISKNKEYHNNIMRVTFLKNILKDSEGVGGTFEGLAPGYHRTNDYDSSCRDMDFVHYVPGIKMADMTIITANDLKIIPVSMFPGYVHIQLPPPYCTFLPNNIFNTDLSLFKQITVSQEQTTVKITHNGPALTHYQYYLHFEGYPIILKQDIVSCLLFKSWPKEANKWVNRNKPNNWPSHEMITKIKSKGFTLAPIGHYDCTKNKLQWRIAIRGEKELLSNLNHTQIMCYVAFKLILKGDLQRINEDALSSYHAKNVIFWCVEQESCLWTKQNFEICLKTCINRLITFITSEHFPHYFLEDRNMINSKMTPQLKEQFVEALNKYSNNSLAILSISFFDWLKYLTNNFKIELLECAIQTSVIVRCIGFYLEPICDFSEKPNRLWESYWGHNTDVNIKNAQDILHILKSTKRHFIRYHIAYAKNMLGLLCYSRYRETRCKKKDILEVRKLLMSSLTFENISLKCRAATFLYMENFFTDCLNVCSYFLEHPSKYKSRPEKILRAQTVLTAFNSLIDFKPNNVTELTDLKRKILSIFFDKCLSETIGDERQFQAETLLERNRNVVDKIYEGYFNGFTLNDLCFILFKIRHLQNDLTNDALLSVFENFTNLVFRDMSLNVPFLAAEKWAVPEVIHYELLSVQEYHPYSCVYGIYMDPTLNCLVLKFLCYQETNMLKQRDNILTTMNNYINEYLKLTDSRQTVSPELPHSLPMYRVYNIVAYCCFQAGSYKMALSHILNSFKLYGNAENTAYGYIRCVCGILNSLYN